VRVFLRQCILGLTGLVAATLGPAALADPGDNIKIGPSTTLAPRLEFGLLARTNLTQVPNDPIGGVSMTVAPGGRLVHDTPDTYVALDGSYRVVKFFTRRLSGLDQFNDFDVQFDASLARTRPVGFVVSNRAALVNNNATDRLGNTPFHTRTRNDLSAGVQVRPGASLQLDLRGKYEWDSIRVPFGAVGSDTRGLNQRNGYGGRWDIEYRFYPRTSFVVEGDLTRFDWQRNVLERGATGNVFAMPDSTHFRLLTGIRGRFTDRVVAVAQLGYGLANYSVDSVTQVCSGRADCTPSVGNQFDASLSGLQRLLVVGQIGYEFAPGREITIGYRKDFDDVFFTNFMAYHMVHAGARSTLGERFVVDGRVVLRQEDYRGALPARSDLFVNAEGGGELLLQDWLRLRLAAGYISRNVPTNPAISFNDYRGRLLMIVTY